MWEETRDIGGYGRTPLAADAQIAAIAAPQHGIITRQQLLSVGLGPDAIEYRVRIGRLHRVHRGVYAVGHRPPSPLARAAAAVLACGPGAALSHRSAGALWEVGVRWPARMDVLVPGDRRVRGVEVHRSRTIGATVHYGIRVTTPARTILDLADVLDAAALTRAVNEAQLNAHMRLEDLAALLARSPGRRGASRLRQFVEHADAPTRSVFEDAFVAFVERFELPRPELNQIIAGYEVDAVWHEQRLIVELDGRTYHDTTAAFEYDREKDAHLLSAGWRIVRVTWSRLTQQPEREAARLRKLLELR